MRNNLKVNIKEWTEKIKVIHIADNKIELNKRIQEIDGYKLTNISPISMSIPNLINIEPNENCIIVNMEDKTTITTIIDSKIYHVDVLDEGSTDIQLLYLLNIN